VGRSRRYVLDIAVVPAAGFVNHLRLSVRDRDASARFYDPDAFKLEVLHVRR